LEFEIFGDLMNFKDFGALSFGNLIVLNF